MTPLDYTDQQATPLAVLTHAIAQLAGARDASHVVEIIRATARSMIGCQGIAVIRKEDDLCHYIEEDAIGALWKGQKFPASACVSGWAMAERKTIVIPDIDHEDRVPRELYQDTFVRAIAMTPVRPQDPIGAIGLLGGTLSADEDGDRDSRSAGKCGGNGDRKRPADRRAVRRAGGGGTRTR